MSRKRKRFNSEKSAQSFAKKVNGTVNDLREISRANSPFTVTYESNSKTRAHSQRLDWSEKDWCPEESRDFGYPNDYWQ